MRVWPRERQTLGKDEVGRVSAHVYTLTRMCLLYLYLSTNAFEHAEQVMRLSVLDMLRVHQRALQRE